MTSRPAQCVVGGGRNLKYIRDCRELHLGRQGIARLRGFERFLNLEHLWLNDNHLRHLNNLESNVRIRELFAQNNRICTLRGSLARMKFLTHLDLSGNLLCDAAKVARALSRFQFLQHLNLRGNPLCDEPGYRDSMVAACSSVTVLDQRMVTSEERQAAKLRDGAAQRVDRRT